MTFFFPIAQGQLPWQTDFNVKIGVISVFETDCNIALPIIKGSYTAQE